MTDGDMGLLDALRIVGGNVQEQVDPAGQFAARLAGERNAKGAAAGARFHSADTFGLLPLVESATRTSPGATSDSTCRSKMRSNPKSLPAAVRTEEFVVRASAARLGRSLCSRTVSSAAKCCASAALPPLPKKTTLPPRARASAERSAKDSMRASNSSEKLCFTRQLSRSWA